MRQKITQGSVIEPWIALARASHPRGGFRRRAGRSVGGPMPGQVLLHGIVQHLDGRTMLFLGCGPKLGG
jgi:hypothetical protein